MPIRGSGKSQSNASREPGVWSQAWRGVHVFHHQLKNMATGMSTPGQSSSAGSSISRSGTRFRSPMTFGPPIHHPERSCARTENPRGRFAFSGPDNPRLQHVALNTLGQRMTRLDTRTAKPPPKTGGAPGGCPFIEEYQVISASGDCPPFSRIPEYSVDAGPHVAQHLLH
jgi:hypothetical protein